MKRHKDAVTEAVAAERLRILQALEDQAKVWCEGHSTRLISYVVVQRIVAAISDEVAA